MAEIANDAAFRQALDALSPADQRQLALVFVEAGLDLGTDERLAKVARAVQDAASDEERLDALKIARRSALDSHTRCGAEGDWAAQADYFLARGLIEALSPIEGGKSGNPAWQAAMAVRMARTCHAIKDESMTAEQESKRQYDLLNIFATTE
jgi:hypothetical protein